MNANVENSNEIGNIDVMFAKLARNQFKSWHYAREHRTGLIISFIAKFGTMLISAAAGYFYLSELLNGILTPLQSVCAAVGLLLVTELLTAYFLTKTVKFSLKGQLIPSLIYLLFGIGFYSITFYTSTNGLANRQAAKIDQTTTLANDLSTEKTAITANYNSQINFIKTNPEKFKPGADGVWNVGRLSKNQLNQIAALESEKIKALEKATNENNGYKSENQIIKKVEYKKYYSFVALIMMLQLFANIFLMFSYSRIYIENNRADATKEKLLNQQNTIQGGIENFILGTVNSMQYAILNNLRIPFDYANRGLPIEAPEVKTIGFATNKTAANDIIQITPKINTAGVNTAGVTTASVNTAGVKIGKNLIKNCLYCGKSLEGKYHTAKHCDDTCREKAWELNKGVKLFKKRKK